MLVASENTLEVFNLCSAAVQTSLVFEAPISCVAYYPTCAFAYVGLKNGEAQVVNVEGWSKSLYRIQLKDVQIPMTASDLSVAAIAINPERDDIILLGYACGAINEWEIKTAKVLRRYLADKPLTSLTWDPSGNKFIAGHSNGELVVWTRKKTMSDEMYHPIVNPQRPSPIKRVFWVAPKPTSNDTTIITLGGTDFPNGIVVENLKQKKRTFVALSPKGTELKDAKLVFAPVANLNSSSSSSSSAPGSPSNTAPAMEAVAVVAVNTTGSIFVHALNSEIDERGLLPSVNPPLPFSLENVSVLASLIVSEPNGLLQDLVSTGNIDPTDALKGQTSSLMWPLNGGIFSIGPDISPVILITLMSNNTVIFWDLSMRNCRVPIYRIRLPGVVNTKTNLVFDFCSSSRILHVGNTHDVFVYHFCPETRNVELMTIDESTILAPVPVASPLASQPSSPNLNKSGQSSAPASPQARAPSPQPAEQTEPLPSPPESLDEAAPTPPSPTNTMQQEEPVKASPTTPQESEKLSTSASSTSEPTSPSIPPSTSQASLSGSSASVVTKAPPPRVTMTPLPSQPAGFQFVASMSLAGKPINTVKFESGLQLLAVALGDGRTLVFNTARQYELVYTYNPPANTLPCPPITTHMQFCKAMVGTPERQDEHTLLCMGMDIGSVQTVSITSPAKVFKPISARKSPVVDIQVVGFRGNHASLPKARWSRDPNAPAPASAPRSNEPQFLVVCTVNDVRAYKIPEFEMVSQYDCPAPISWYGTIQVAVDVQGKLEQEFVLAAIDMASNVLYIRLMNLTLVSYVGPNNFTKLGVEGVSPMTTPKSCNLLDGTVVLFTESSETYIVKVLPFEERRPVTKLLGPEPPKPIAKRSKGLKGLIGKDKDVDFEAVFGPRKDTAQTASPSSPASSSSGSNAPKAPPKPTAIQGQTGEIKGVMQQNMEALEQRGEKLKDLADRTEDMKEGSRNFAQLAKQLSQQQKSSWF